MILTYQLGPALLSVDGVSTAELGHVIDILKEDRTTTYRMKEGYLAHLIGSTGTPLDDGPVDDLATAVNGQATPGPVERAVMDECADSNRPQYRVQTARHLARIIDDPNSEKDHARVSRQLANVMNWNKRTDPSGTAFPSPTTDRQHLEPPDFDDEDALARIAFNAYMAATGQPGYPFDDDEPSHKQGWRAASAAVRAAALLAQADRAFEDA